MGEGWAEAQLAAAADARSLFVDLVGSLAVGPEALTLVHALARRVTVAFAQAGVIARAEVEHEETVEDPGDVETTFLCFPIYAGDKGTITLKLAPPNTEPPPFAAAFWNVVGHVTTNRGCTLYGAFNTSVWQNDSYKLEGVKDKALLSRLADLWYGVIETGDHQWVVTGEDRRQLHLVTGLLHRDFSGKNLPPSQRDLMELDTLSEAEVGNVYLRLLCAKVWGLSTKTILKPEMLIEPVLTEDPVPVDLTNLNLCAASPNWADGIPRDTKVLKLNQNDLPALPEALRKLSKLETLELKNNRLRTLPEWIGELKALRALSLSSNPLRALPEAIGQLTALETFACVGAELETIPESIGSLARLTWLDLSRGTLAKLPDRIGDLAALMSLDLEGNKLTSLPNTFASLKALQTLNLKGNAIDFVPLICDLTELTTLDLSNAAVTAIPEDIARLHALRHLNLGRNAIRRVPDVVMSLPALTFLEVSKNELTTLPDFSRALLLRWLYATDNRIDRMPDGLTIPPALRELWLMRNRFTAFDPKLVAASELTYVDLHENPLSEESVAALRALGKRALLD